MFSTSAASPMFVLEIPSVHLPTGQVKATELSYNCHAPKEAPAAGTDRILLILRSSGKNEDRGMIVTSLLGHSEVLM